MKSINFRKIMLKSEKQLSKYATFDKDAIRFKEMNNDIRPNFYRDTDKIIHSLSFTRYIDKTQVFTKSNNDNISKRIIHVILVSKISRTIGRALLLNEDLIEAIALGHDIGHTPFGHEGEYILNEICLKNNLGFFNHNAHSVRTLMHMEDNGVGKNLTIQVLDGILCHNGELPMQEYKPKKKRVEDFLDDYNNTYTMENYSKRLIPMTLEGCVVRISDIIGYIGRDIEDAIKLGIIHKKDIPAHIKKVLGCNNREIVNTIIIDIINNSYNKSFIKLSDDVYKAIIDLKKFNYENIYKKAHTKKTINYYTKAFNSLFNYYLENIANKNCSIDSYLKSMSEIYLKNTPKERMVIDYIAGMTDDYFIHEFEQINKNK